MIKYLNLSLFILFPIAWFAPMAKAGLLPWFGLKELSVISSIGSLWESDVFLAFLVGFFALFTPMLKTIMLAMIHQGWLGGNMLAALGVLGKLAMADVFLIALYIVSAKGVGVGRIETGWGLYLFTFCVLLSLLITEITKKRLVS
ncbi:MAG: paraquat-inducible protein A [Rhodobacteraceae bacterium]|nr:paraquat-inducible protein A [Paracoccaceae bacterium]